MPARNHKGERIIIFVGLIDILQSYRLIKKLEHTFKAMIHDGVSKSRKQANNWAMILRTRSPFTGLASTPSDSWRLCRRKSSRRFPHVSDDHSGKTSLTPHHPPLSQRCGATPPRLCMHQAVVQAVSHPGTTCIVCRRHTRHLEWRAGDAANVLMCSPSVSLLLECNVSSITPPLVCPFVAQDNVLTLNVHPQWTYRR